MTNGSKEPTPPVWPAPGSSDRDGVTVEAPERIAFSFETAGIGSRGLALMIDGIVLLLLLAFLSGAFILMVRGSLEAGSRAWALALLVVAVYGVVWGYFAYFETRWHGQTPGKRILGLRVVQDSGVGIGFLEAALRNVLRVVDFLPAFFSFGLVVMFFNRRGKRIGDLVAGTLVIKERRWALQRLVPRDETLRRRQPGKMDRWAAASALAPADYELLADYLDRRKAFPGDVRLRLARSLTAPHLRAAGMPEAAIASLTLDDFESWVKARFSALEQPAREVGAWRHLHDFVRRRREGWSRLSALLERIQGAPWSQVSHGELRELGALYRRTTADYAYAQLRFPRTDTLLYLNQLVARGHNAVYRRPPITAAALTGFFTHRFPAAVRASSDRIWLAAAIFSISALFGFLAVSTSEEVATIFLSREAIEEHVHQGRLWTEDLVAVLPSAVASARILGNNVTVALLCFAFGITCGIGTVGLLFLNGAMLGVVAGLCARYGLSGSLWTFVAAHGPLEVTGLLLAAGAGMTLAQALVAPGDLRRRDALRLHARTAMTVVLGAVPILFVAGFLEGYVSAAPHLPAVAKVATGLVTAAALGVYLARAGT